MRKFLFAIIMGAFLLSACSAGLQSPMMPFGNNSGTYQSNGAQIYFTGYNQSGEQIDYAGGPAFGGMMRGNQLSCASCHGDDGRGGTHFMHMQTMDAPDIRLSALQGDEEDTSHDDEHDDAHASYDLESFRQAVVLGKHPNGDATSKEMPRWALDDSDLADLFDFISTLQ